MACGGSGDVGSNAAVAIEFVFDRHGGLCASPDGGGDLCRLRVVVHDDGTWAAEGAPLPEPIGGMVRPGAASELATIVDGGWEALTARPFTGTCPVAYDGSEVAYTVRRIPQGASAPFADADIREVRSCTHDFGHAEAVAVIRRLEALWRELDLPS